MDKEQLLTTGDNPFNPFTEWREWYEWDERKGHHTTGLIARFTVTSDAFPEADQEQDIQDAMDYIVQEGVYGDYRLVDRPKEAVPQD